MEILRVGQTTKKESCFARELWYKNQNSYELAQLETTEKRSFVTVPGLHDIVLLVHVIAASAASVITES
jgi:hypothetical protein